MIGAILVLVIFCAIIDAFLLLAMAKIFQFLKEHTR